MANKEKWEKLTDLMALRNNKYDEWLRHILIGASGLIGILIALHKDKSSDITTHYLFSATILLIALGILAGSISLYANIDSLNQLIEDLKQRLSGQSDTSSGGNIIVGNPSKFYETSRKICYVSFALAIPALVAYAVMLDR